MGKASHPGWRQKLLVGLVIATASLSSVWHGAEVAADVTEVRGSASGYFASVSLFGGPPGDQGPSPTVTLSAAGGRESDSLPSGVAQYGPASIFGSDELTVRTEGTTGPDGSVTSSVAITNVDNEGAGGPFNAGEVMSTCTATEGELSGSTTFTDAIVELELDPDTVEPVVVEDLPANPAPNTEFTGTIDNVGDNFRIVFNEQTVEDGTITVRAAHLYLLGPIAIGELIIAESVCGVTASDAGLPDVGGATTTSVADGVSTSTTARPSTSAPTTPAQPRFTG